MRKIIAGLFMSLDGVVEAPQTWHFPYFNEEMGGAVGAQMAAADTMLLGRHTYEEFAAHWSTQGSEVPFADQMNNTPKLVVSSTLESADWKNSTVVNGDVAKEIARIKELPGGNLAISGSPTLVRFLLKEGLLDELRVLLHPIVVGHGARLFDNYGEQQGLKLTESATFSTGVLNLTYVRA